METGGSNSEIDISEECQIECLINRAKKNKTHTVSLRVSRIKMGLLCMSYGDRLSKRNSEHDYLNNAARRADS